jgi:hypothetical protein
VAKRKIKNVAASVRQRLSDLAKSTGRPFQEVAQYYAMERWLFRLAQSKHAERFVLKGALMMTAWGASATRPTRDIDLLGHMTSSIDAVTNTIRDVCRQAVEADGVSFDPDSITGIVIKEDADYEGVRVLFRGSLENMVLPMQIDVGFGDAVVPVPAPITYPTLLDHPAPLLRGYRQETAIAEKFEAMTKLGLLNSRMKDFFDIFLLSRQFDFDGEVLRSAIETTFRHRGTTVSPEPTAFTTAFASDASKVSQWQGFLRKSKILNTPTDLATIIAGIAMFLSPPAAAIRDGNGFDLHWRAPGPWVSTS